MRPGLCTGGRSKVEAAGMGMHFEEAMPHAMSSFCVDIVGRSLLLWASLGGHSWWGVPCFRAACGLVSKGPDTKSKRILLLMTFAQHANRSSFVFHSQNRYARKDLSVDHKPERNIPECSAALLLLQI